MTSDASADEGQQPAVPVGPRGGAAAEQSETDRKLDLIAYSYAEVLDATKHQDDKIGQLLTSVSFLTATTLALAALESGSFITRTFDVVPYKLPLALITLIAFLIGVAWSVMLLLASLYTPLRVPGLTRPKRDKPIDWVKDVRTSQIYFYEICRVSVGQWEEKWSAPVEDLKQERLRSLIRETPQPRCPDQCKIRPDDGGPLVPGGPARMAETYSSSWMRPSKVRLLIISSATSR